MNILSNISVKSNQYLVANTRQLSLKLEENQNQMFHLPSWKHQHGGTYTKLRPDSAVTNNGVSINHSSSRHFWDCTVSCSCRLGKFFCIINSKKKKKKKLLRKCKENMPVKMSLLWDGCQKTLLQNRISLVSESVGEEIQWNSIGLFCKLFTLKTI